MNRISVGAALLALSLPFVANAQFYPVQREPGTWLGLGIGAFNAGEVADGKTGSTWDFGQRSSPQYRLSLEKAYRNNMSLGIAGTYVRAPILYSGQAVLPSDVPGATCVSCAADVDVYSLYALFHSGGGQGFHQVIEAGLGVTSYQNFRRESDDARLAPTSAERDFAFIFAYGFGYTLTPRAAVNLVQEYGFNFHESRGTPSNASNTLRFSNTRIGLRFGMGGRGGTGGPRRRR